jgi:hypothetical protein
MGIHLKEMYQNRQYNILINAEKKSEVQENHCPAD